MCTTMLSMHAKTARRAASGTTRRREARGTTVCARTRLCLCARRVVSGQLGWTIRRGHAKCSHRLSQQQVPVPSLRRYPQQSRRRHPALSHRLHRQVNPAYSPLAIPLPFHTWGQHQLPLRSRVCCRRWHRPRCHQLLRPRYRPLLRQRFQVRLHQLLIRLYRRRCLLQSRPSCRLATR